MQTDPSEQAPDEVTRLLDAIRDGDADAKSRLVALLYRELRHLARYYINGERVGHTIQPTALVHEVFVRLADQRADDWTNRAHFIASASVAMRRVLTDHARARNAAKRGGVQCQVTLSESLAVDQGSGVVDALALDEALGRLARLDARQSQIVELHFFGGLSFEEIASLLNIHARTVRRDWRMARAFLHSELSAEAPGGETSGASA